MIFSKYISLFPIIHLHSCEILLVPAQSNVALLVDKLVSGGQTFQGIVGHPASVAEISICIYSVYCIVYFVYITSCQHSKVLLEDSFSSWLQKLNTVARRMSQSEQAASYNLVMA